MPTPEEYYRQQQEEAQNALRRSALIVSQPLEKTPDEYAKAAAIAKSVALPTALIEPNIKTFQQRMLEKRTEMVLGTAPALTDWITRDDNYRIAQDDIDGLSWWEKGLPGVVTNAVSRGVRRLPQAYYQWTAMNAAERNADMNRGFGEILNDETSVTVRGERVQVGSAAFVGAPDLLAAASRWATSRMSQAFGIDEKAAAQVYQQKAGQVAKDIGAIKMSEPGERFKKEFAKVGAAGDWQSQLQTFAQIAAADPSGLLAFLGETSLESVPSIAGATVAGVVTKSPTAAAAVLGAQSAATEYGTAPVEFFQEHGIDVSTPDGAMAAINDPELMRKADERGVTRGLIIGIMDGLSGGVAGKALSQSVVGNLALQSIVQAGMGAGGEAGAQVASGQNLNLGDIIVEGLAEFATAPLEVAGIGGRAMIENRAKAREAATNAQTIADISSQAQASILRQRMPEKFREYIAAATVDGPVENVYVPAQDFVEYFQSQGIDPFDLTDELEGVSRDDLSAALAGGGDLRIPTATYASALAGSAADPFLMENMRFSPDAMTTREASEFNAMSAEVMEEAWQEAERIRVQEESLRGVEERIYTDMQSRLRQAGRTTDVANAEATLYPAFYRVMAQRSGMPVEEFLARYPLPQVEGVRPEGIQSKDVSALNRTLAEARMRRAPVADKRQSLLEFISERGGINDVGGELKARDARVVKQGKGKKNLRLARDMSGAGQGSMLGGSSGGISYGVDDVAHAAIEAGFMADNPEVMAYKHALAEGGEVPDIVPALWDAIDRELRGERQTSADEVAPDTDRDEALDQLEEYLASLGASLDDDDAAILAAIRQDEDARRYAQFAGPQSETADLNNLVTAKAEIAKGRDPEAVRRETGWHRGVDGRWRYEISDDEATINVDELPTKDGEASGVTLADLLEHDKLYAAYPDLKAVAVEFDSGMEAKGSVDMPGMTISLNPTKFDGPADILSTLLHEVQHLIQRREGFARGGGTGMSEAVKEALSQLSGHKDYLAKLWTLRNGEKIAEADRAAALSTYVNMYGSFEQLIRYANSDRPSGQLRHIRGNANWLYHPMIQGNEELRARAAELSRSFYSMPKAHRLRERNAWLRDYSFNLAQILREAMPADVFQQFRDDPRQTKSIENALYKAARKARDELKPMHELERDAKRAKSVEDATKFKTPFEVYSALAGEIEARNTQARAAMTDEERAAKSPERTADVSSDEAIVVFQDGEIEAPFIANMEMPEQDGELNGPHLLFQSDRRAEMMATTDPVSTVASRFSMSPNEVQSILDTPVDELRERDRYQAPSNTDAPTEDFPHLPAGSVKIGLYGDPAEAYVEILRPFDPNALISTEAESGIKDSATYQNYVQWFREGKEAPPVFVAESDKGDGKLLTTNRRRTLAAQEAGVTEIMGWFSPHNPETGLPLKYGDITRAIDEASRTHAETRRAEMLATREFFAGMEPGEFRNTVPYSSEPDYHRFQYVTPDGVAVTGNYTLDGDTIDNFSITSEGGPRSVGAKVTREIGRALKAAHPEAATLMGYRLSGARRNAGGGDEFVSFDLRRFYQSSEEPLIVYRGEGGDSGGGNYFSFDREFARNFTRSGQDKEIREAAIAPSDVYEAETLPLATNEGQIDAAISEAQAQGKKAIRVDEGDGEPNSIFVFDKSAIKTRRAFEQDSSNGPRGSIQFPAAGLGNGDTIIRLSEKADLSTFLHESGHYFLTVMQDMAEKGEPSAANEFQAIKGWWRENAKAVAKDANKAAGSARGALNQSAAPVIERVLYRGTNGSSERITGGIAEGTLFAADSEDVARLYGDTIEKIGVLPGAKILVEGTAEFAKLTGRRRGKLWDTMRKGENIKSAADDAAEKARAAGYDAVEFNSMRDLGIAIFNEAAFVRDYAEPAAGTSYNQDRVDPSLTGEPVRITEDDVIRALDTGTSGDPFKDMLIDVGMQEQWARGFEQYVMEGKAPSAELRSAFERFRAWLISVYRKLSGLNVAINDDLRQVFNRMLATDEEIAQATEDSGGDGMVFATAEEMGLTDEEYSRFLTLRQQAEEEGKARLLKETMAPVKRAQQQWYKEERAAVHEEMSAQINREPVYRAIEWMGNRRWIGEDAPEAMPDIRLSKDILVDRYGAGILKTLPRGQQTVYTVEGGLDPDDAAGWFGFDSGDQMLQSMEKAMKRTDAIDAATDRAMYDRHGDIMRDGTIEEAALEALHNDKRGQWIAAELEAVRKIMGEGAHLTAKQAREIAKQTIARMKVRDAMASQRFLAAERKAGKEAAALGASLSNEGYWANRAAFMASDPEGRPIPNAQQRDQVAALYSAKRRQLLNHALYSEARKVADEVAKAERLAASFTKSEKRKKIAGAGRRENAQIDYLGAIDEILDRYDFRRMSGAAEQRRGALNLYVEQMTAAGRENELAIPEEVLAQAQRLPYKTIPVEELRGVVDTLRNLEHTAGRWNKLIDAQKERDFTAAVEDVIGSFEANIAPRPPGRVSSTAEDWRNTGRKFFDLVLNSTTLLREIDGREDFGPAYSNIKSPIDEAMNRLIVRKEQAATDLEALYDVYSKDERRAMGVRKYIDELGYSLSKWEMISVALNTGNEGNYQRLTDSRVRGSLSDDQVIAVLSRLDVRDAKFVQSVWDYLETFRPDIAERERRATGVQPDWVEAKPVEIAGIELKGGYYPLKYDPRLSSLARDDEMANLAQSMQAGRFGKAQTRNGHLKERGASSGRDVELDMAVLHKHVNQVMYDLELSEPVTNSWRILQDGRVRDRFVQSGRQADFDALEAWLKDVAEGEVKSADFVGRAARMAKTNFTAAKLAFNLSTVAMQITGLSQSMVVVGKQDFAVGVMQSFRGAARDEIVMRSPYMKTRQTTFNKDIYDFYNDPKLGPVASRWGDFKQNIIGPLSFWLMTKVQYHIVDVPTWLAGYNKGLRKFGNDETKAVAYADDVVKRAQSSGLFSDRSAIERGSVSAQTRQNDVVRLFTTLASYMFAKFNVAYERGAQAGAVFRQEGVSLKSAQEALSWTIDMAFLFTLEAVVTAAIKGGLPGGDDDDDEALAAEWMKFLAKETAFSAMGTVPFIRDIASFTQGFESGGGYGGIVADIGKPFKEIAQGEFDKGFVKSVIGATGLATGLPATQINRAVDAAWREAEGEDVSVVEYFLGKPRKSAK